MIYPWNKISLRLYQSVEYYSNPENVLVPQFDNSSVQNSQDPEKFTIMSLYLYCKGQAYNHESWIHNVVILIRWQLYGSIHIRFIFQAYEKSIDFRLKCHLTEVLKEIKRKTLMWRTWPKHRLCYELLKQQVFSCKSDIHLHSILNGKSIYHHDRIIGVKTK